MNLQKPLRHLDLLWMSCFVIIFFTFVIIKIIQDEKLYLNPVTQVYGNIINPAECVREKFQRKSKLYYRYKLQISYTYEFQGKSINSIRIYRNSIDDVWYEKKDCQDVIRKLINAQNIVEVWIDPRHPELGMLDPTIKSLFNFYIVLPAIFFGFMLLILFISLNKKRNE